MSLNVLPSAESHVVYRVFFVLVHFIFTVIENFNEKYTSLKRTLSHYYKQPCLSNDSTYINSITCKLTKTPSDLCFILQDGTATVEDVSNIIRWSFFADIPFLTIYDHSGAVPVIKDKYVENLERNGVNCDHIYFHSKNGMHKNGFSQKMHVLFQSRVEGKNDYLATVKEISKTLHWKSDFSSEFISAEFYKLAGFKDPDLAVICGPVPCTYGYSPWNIRFTELILIESLRNITVSKFCDFLVKYSTIQRRFGK